MSGEYYCEFCNAPIWDSLHMCTEKYDYEWDKLWDDMPYEKTQVKIVTTIYKVVQIPKRLYETK